MIMRRALMVRFPSFARTWSRRSSIVQVVRLCRRERNGGGRGTVALRPLIGERAALADVVDSLGNVGGVVAHALDVLRAEEQMRAERDVARVFHHVGEKLAEQRVVD